MGLQCLSLRQCAIDLPWHEVLTGIACECRIAEKQQLGNMVGLQCLSLRHCAMDLDQPPLMHLLAPMAALNSLAFEPPPSYIVAPSARGLEVRPS